MLKKAGIIVATAAAGLLAVSPLAFAGDTGYDHDKKDSHYDGGGDIDKSTDVDQDGDGGNANCTNDQDGDTTGSLAGIGSLLNNTNALNCNNILNNNDVNVGISGVGTGVIDSDDDDI